MGALQHSGYGEADRIQHLDFFFNGEFPSVRRAWGEGRKDVKGIGIEGENILEIMDEGRKEGRDMTTKVTQICSQSFLECCRRP